MQEIYLDYNASAPLDPRVAEEMLPVLTAGVGNAASAHRFGRRQAAAVEMARDQVAALVGGTRSGVVFTAGATEANNIALRGAVEATAPERTRLLISAVEHASVRQTAHRLAERGLAKVDVIGVTPGGFVDLDALDGLLDADVLMVSVMAANSETGVLNPVAEVAERARAAGVLFHCDATQYVGRLPFNMAAVGADLVSLSSHKICGPGGVGALVGAAAALRRLTPVISGGGHERGLRSGSLNVAGIVGFGVAARIAAAERTSESTRVEIMRDRLVAAVQARLSGVSQNGDVTRRLPNTANLRFADADADAVIANMDPVAVSAGSACSTGAVEPSPVLVAMGLSREAAFESLRFSLGRFTTEADIEPAASRTATAVQYVRGVLGEGA